MKCLDKKTFNRIIDDIPVRKTYERGYECRLVITGSFLLHLHGLVDSFDDVDILVVDAPESFWIELSSSVYKWDIRDYGDYKSVKVVFDDVTYNLIKDDLYTEFTNGYADLNGEIELDTLSHALKAKARLRREKDKPHFEQIKNKITQLIQ
ncbi:hypothetical protein JGH11_18775 [Dysgonomonas sp. Marseille-P4677]|uniref:hypothetical protein n=1 Tax=Dysgonomonas sp. Marseille-P4677 TaxID=2364790 RepID=UPI001913E29B|nr:hypothetical protein [Dysgonomonas sp. Marseille-P4677]MBK5722918.1 hypothetical protein [Dysgonomonas sp. Marseille-P4677]